MLNLYCTLNETTIKLFRRDEILGSAIDAQACDILGLHAFAFWSGKSRSFHAWKIKITRRNFLCSLLRVDFSPSVSRIFSGLDWHYSPHGDRSMNNISQTNRLIDYIHTEGQLKKQQKLEYQQCLFSDGRDKELWLTECDLSQFCVALASFAPFALKTVRSTDLKNTIKLFFSVFVDRWRQIVIALIIDLVKIRLTSMIWLIDSNTFDRWKRAENAGSQWDGRSRWKMSNQTNFFSNNRVLVKKSEHDNDDLLDLVESLIDNSTVMLNSSIRWRNDDSSNRIQGKSFENLADFRRDFYLAKHHLIKSSLKDQPDLQITNIRLAAIDESVQNKFLEQLNQVSSHPPQLVYHGTQLANFESILRFGLLVPNRCHPKNPDAPLITVKNGQAHGMGIYSSLTASFSVLYLKSTNTLLACATLPQRDKRGNISNLHGNILVLTKESRIIPMFLVDFKRSNVGQKNFPLFRPPPMEIVEPIMKESPIKSPRKYFRKLLDCLHDETKQKNRYQVRTFDVYCWSNSTKTATMFGCDGRASIVDAFYRMNKDEDHLTECLSSSVEWRDSH